MVLALGLTKLVKPNGFNGRSPASSYSWEECNIFKLANEINSGNRLPANVIFRFGKKDLSMQYAQAHTVPEDLWKTKILSEDNRFRLKPFRRGLYGTELLEDADQYGNETYNWALEIEIKSECLSSKYIATMEGLSFQPKFKKWYEKGKLNDETLPSFKEWTDRCYLSSGQANGNEFEFYDSLTQDQNICESIVERYWNENDIRIVQDILETRSWYIRDRACIAEIRGLPSHWSSAFLKNKNLWDNQCDPYRTHHNAIRVWFASLLEIATADIANLNFKEFPAFLSPLRSPLVRGDIDFAAQDFSHEFVDSFERCKFANQLPAWQLALGHLSKEIDGMSSEELKERLGELCR